MTTLGSVLKNKRLEKGLTIDDIQQVTKIQKRYLLAIEDDKFDVMPGQFYVRAFVKQYADALKINGDKLLEEFPPGVVKETPNSFVKEEKADELEPAEKGRKKWLSFAILAVLATAIIVIIFYAVQLFAQQPASQSESQTTTKASLTTQVTLSTTASESTSSQVDASSTAKTESQTTESTQTTTATTTAATTASVATGQLTVQTNGTGQSVYNLTSDWKNYTDKYTVTISVSAPTWIRVESYGKEIVNRTLPAGSSIPVYVDNDSEYVTVQTGNAANTTVTFNGQAIAIQPAPAAQAMRFNLIR